MDTQTKKCPKCFTDIPAKATKCPNCQSDIRKPSKLLWGFAIVSVLIVVILGQNLAENPPAPMTTVADPVEWAGTYAQVYVKKTLKAPSTAQFGVVRSSNVTDLGNSQYRVSSYVDSQNGFGAMIRSNWEVTLTYNGGDADLAESWVVEKIVVDGKVVAGR